MKNLFYILLMASLIGLSASGCSKDDDESGDSNGPAGSAEMLCGVWGATHLWAESQGQVIDEDVDASVSTFTFNSNGSLTELQNGSTAHGTWTYDPNSRKLHITNAVSNLFYVKTLTETTLILDTQVTVQNVSMHMIATYKRLDNRVMTQPASTASSNESASILSSMIQVINLK
ncbi:MAG: hypothetical protein RRY23_07855 [Alistipes sp.]